MFAKYFFTVLLLLFISPSIVKVGLIIVLLYLLFRKPEFQILLIIITPIFDDYFYIPFIGRSILYLSMPISILGFLVKYNMRSSMVKLFPSAISLIILLLISTFMGYQNVVEVSGFSDPSRGIIFTVSIIFLTLIVMSKEYPYIRRSLVENSWMITILYIISIIVSLLFTQTSFDIETQRFQGTFGDPNYFTRYGILAILSAIISFKKAGVRLISIGLILCALVLAASKTLLFIGAIFLIYYIYKHFTLRSFIRTGLIIVLLLLILYPFIFDAFSDRFQLDANIIVRGNKIENRVDVLTSGRTYIWRYFAEEISGMPTLLFFGKGIGYSKSFFIPLFGEQFASHNMLIDIVLDTGLLGFTFLLMFFLLLFKQIDSNYEVVMQNTFPYILIFYLIYGFTLSGFWVVQNIAFIYFIVLNYGTRINNRKI